MTGTNDNPVAGAVAIEGYGDRRDLNRRRHAFPTRRSSDLTFAITSAPAEGSVVNNGDGTFTYDPEAASQDLALG